LGRQQTTEVIHRLSPPTREPGLLAPPKQGGDIGIYQVSSGLFLLDSNGNGSWDAGIDRAAPFGQAGDLPVSGRW
jgi:hypothetical protein